MPEKFKTMASSFCKVALFFGNLSSTKFQYNWRHKFFSSPCGPLGGARMRNSPVYEIAWFLGGTTARSLD